MAPDACSLPAWAVSAIAALELRSGARERFSAVDAGLIAVAERLGVPVIATLDRRHFGGVRPSHAKVLTLIP